MRPNRFERIPARIWFVVQAASVACVVFSFLGFGGTLHWYLDQFSHFRVQLFVALVIAIPLLLAGRKWKSALLAAVGICINLTALLPHAIGTSRSNEGFTDAPVLRCISINLLQGNEQHETLEDFVRSSGADIIVFQEVSPPWGKVLRNLTDIYPTHLVRDRKDSKGAALLSKYPARRLEFELMPGQSQIGAMMAEIETAGGFIKVFGIHSHKPTSAKGSDSQRRYFDWLAKRTTDERAEGRHVVIMGDWNSTPWSSALRRFVSESQLLNTSRGVVFGATWNPMFPHRLMIDHGFISSELKLISRKVGPSVGSDHRPLILDIALPVRR